MLAKIWPDMFVSQDAPWQARKSGEMRIRILESTIDCLVENGYARLSINNISQRAGISRGAMHHHFSNRMMVVAAVIEYTFYQRMERFLADFFRTAKPSGKLGFVKTASDLHWRSMQTREYAAYLELAIAARTDDELNSFFHPAARKFDMIWTREMINSFPQWKEHWDALQVASDFAVAAHLGLLLHKPVFGAGKRSNAVRDLITQTIMQIYANM